MSKNYTPFEDDLFWAKVNQENDCWIWTGYINDDGYGRLSRGAYPHLTHSHRYSYVRTYGEIPEGMIVLHSCDNPPCVNPNHLQLGTVKDNVTDMARKDRHGKITIKSEDVEHIIQRVKNGETQISLAREFGVAHSTISRYISGVRRNV